MHLFKSHLWKCEKGVEGLARSLPRSLGGHWQGLCLMNKSALSLRISAHEKNFFKEDEKAFKDFYKDDVALHIL
jgi:hypothetical protein